MSREEKKLLLEQLLDELIEQHKPYYEAADRLCKELSPTAYILVDKREITLRGVVELGGILGCCIKFVPDTFITRATIEYKGFLFVENLF